MGHKNRVAIEYERRLEQAAHLTREAQLHAWKLQVALVAALERFNEGKPMPLGQEERARIVDLELGVEIREVEGGQGLCMARVVRPSLDELARVEP